MKKLLYVGIALSLALWGCQENSSTENNTTQEPEGEEFALKSEYSVVVKELGDEEYPDNPDIGYRSDLYQKFSHKDLVIKVGPDTSFSFVFKSTTEGGSDVTLSDLDIWTFMIGVPEWIKSDPYLTRIGIINQEWNRQQVKFTLENKELVVGEGEEGKNIVRVDLARNCLNSGLWEIAMWRDEDGKSQIYYHGWFDFPIDLYSFLVSTKNNLEFDTYKSACVEWTDPESKSINLDLLRTVKDTVKLLSYGDFKHGFYTKKGARLKKFKNIIYPQNPDWITKFLTDSTQFATFSVPGFYNTKDPRSTELGRFWNLNNLVFKNVSNPNTSQDDLFEIELSYTDKQPIISLSDTTRLDSVASVQRKTTVIFGGISKASIPTLSKEDMNDGFKMPMGIANHSFYEDYNFAVASDINNNPYYGLILDENGNWLDSHKIGIDGPLLYWDARQKHLLHLWLLSFERHAFVGHYTMHIE